MTNVEKFQGILPAFYACYEDNGEVSVERTKALVRYFIEAGVQGLYVNGSSGECIYLSVEDRKQILEAVMAEAKGKLRIIAHVACNNTKDSVAGEACGKFRGRCHCSDSSHLLPSAKLQHCGVLEYHQCGSTQYRLHHLQYPPACRSKSYQGFIHGNEEKSQSHRGKELLHACSGYSELQGLGWRGLRGFQRPG